MKNKRLYKKIFKRMFDFLIALVLLIILSPVLIIISLVVRNKMGSPVIFKQQRPGKNGNVFIMYKFRTMTDVRDENGNLLPNELRHTKFGKLLRKTSLDELPELINVLKGEMSLVGPRPLLVEYLPLYTEEQATRHDVLPGITGYAQVNGRNSISWEDKFEKDVYYVNNVSLYLDVKILFQTIFKVFKSEDINKSANITMDKFQGTRNNKNRS